MTTKTKKGRFTPWCWEAERDEYDGESRRGWHLKNRTLRDMTYEYDPEKQYRYAIDYRVGQNETVYLELFEDDGWELIGTVVDSYECQEPADVPKRASRAAAKRAGTVPRSDGCWYIFRKEYDPGRPDGEYEIATDEESIRAFKDTLIQKYRRWLLWDLVYGLYFLFRVWAYDYPGEIFFLAFTGLDMLSNVYRLLCITVLRPRRPMRGLFAYTRWQNLILGGIVIALSASLFIRSIYSLFHI